MPGDCRRRVEVMPSLRCCEQGLDTQDLIRRAERRAFDTDFFTRFLKQIILKQ